VRRLAGLAFLLFLSACGGGETASPPAATADEAPTTTAPATTTEPPPTAPTEPDAAEPLPGLPAWTAGYDEWPKLNGAPIPPRDADPHLSTKEVYASMAAIQGSFPPGTVIVKEGVRPDRDFVGLIAAMRKVAGANPEHDDWVFVEWSREAAGDPFTKLAEGAVCESCHSGVAGQDYVFTEN
jgi:hypothetical protein